MGQQASARLRSDARRRRLRNALLVLMALGMIGGGLAWVWGSTTVTKLVETTSEIFEPPIARPTLVIPGSTPMPTSIPNWEGNEPFNILLLGLDLRPADEDTRADTQIVVHVDPGSRSVSMLSIPRDLLVQVPGYGERRINAAYQLGETDKRVVPGGGPGLSIITIEQNFGIRIHYFAQVDFTGFERIVDSMGGVTLDVPRPLVDNEYPFLNYGFSRIYIPGGLQHMDGRTALRYARSRHADSDLGRAARQQQVLLALRQQGLSLDILSRINNIASDLSGAVRTDIDPRQLLPLAQLAREIDPADVHNEVLKPPAVNEYIVPGSGAEVLLPNWDVIRPLIARTFADPRLAKEGARLSVQNGTNVGGMARKLRDELVPKGFIVVDLSNPPDQGNYPVSSITDYTGGKKPQTLKALAQALGIEPSNVKMGDPEDAKVAPDGEPVDFLVMVGDDRLP